MSILRRLPGERFSEVVPEWKGETVVIIGGGPSLTLEQIATVRAEHAAGRLRCIAVNSAYLWAPFADALYAADSHWFRWHTEGIAIPQLGLTSVEVRERFAAFAGQKCTIQNSGANVADEAVHMLRNKTHPDRAFGLSRDPRALMTGFNSGFQALNMAILAGGTPNLLLGFDGAPSRDGRTHFHGAHPRPTPQEAYPLYRRAMSAAEHDIEELGIEVINCSPGSEINSWPKMALEEALGMVAA